MYLNVHHRVSMKIAQENVGIVVVCHKEYVNIQV
jgi:hypothetical protein